MEIITITVEDRDGKVHVGVNASSGLSSAEAEDACRFIAGQFRSAANKEEAHRLAEIEVERRIAELANEPKPPDTLDDQE